MKTPESPKQMKTPESPESLDSPEQIKFDDIISFISTNKPTKIFHSIYEHHIVFMVDDSESMSSEYKKFFTFFSEFLTLLNKNDSDFEIEINFLNNIKNNIILTKGFSLTSTNEKLLNIFSKPPNGNVSYFQTLQPKPKTYCSIM